MGKTPDLNDVTAFVAAAKAGTLSGAARDMGLPTSTVSRALTRLEEHVGVLLIRRNQRGLVLTDAGKEYLTSCRRALRSLRDGSELIERQSSRCEIPEVVATGLPGNTRTWCD